MYGRDARPAAARLVIFSVMMLMMIGTIVWSVYWDTLQPNPGLTAHAVARTYEIAERHRAGRQTRR